MRIAFRRMKKVDEVTMSTSMKRKRKFLSYFHRSVIAKFIRQISLALPFPCALAQFSSINFECVENCEQEAREQSKKTSSETRKSNWKQQINAITFHSFNETRTFRGLFICCSKLIASENESTQIKKSSQKKPKKKKIHETKKSKWTERNGNRNNAAVMANACNRKPNVNREQIRRKQKPTNESNEKRREKK